MVFAVWFECQAEFLNGGYDNLVGVIVGQQAVYQSLGIGVFFNAAFLETVEFLTGLAVEVFSIYNKQAFVDVGIIFKQGWGFEGGQCFAGTGGVPNIAVATIFMNAVHNGFDGVNLVRTHHQQFLFAGN